MNQDQAHFLSSRPTRSRFGLSHGASQRWVWAVALATGVALLMPDGVGGAEGEPNSSSLDQRVCRVLVAYDSLTGNTEKMAQGVMEGVKRVGGVVPVLKRVGDVSKADLEAADGIILGCPAYYGNMPGRMKVIIDDWSWKMKVEFTDKVGGAFATGGGQTGGKEFTTISLLMFMLNNRMVVAGPLYRNEKTGSVWAEAGASAITGPLDPGVSPSELDGAQRLGERVARLAMKMRRAQTASASARRQGE